MMFHYVPCLKARKKLLLKAAGLPGGRLRAYKVLLELADGRLENPYHPEEGSWTLGDVVEAQQTEGRPEPPILISLTKRNIDWHLYAARSGFLKKIPSAIYRVEIASEDIIDAESDLLECRVSRCRPLEKVA